MNIDDRRPTTHRPQGLFTHFLRISNGHNSPTRHPIPVMFGSRVGFSWTADRTAPFPVGSNPRWQPAAILKNQTIISLKRIPRFILRVNTDLPSVFIMTVDAHDRILDTYFARGVTSRHSLGRLAYRLR